MGSLSHILDLSDMPRDVDQAFEIDKTKARKSPKEYNGKEIALGKGWGVKWDVGTPPGYTDKPALRWTVWKGTSPVYEEWMCWMPSEPKPINRDELDRQWKAHKAFQTGG